MESDPFDFAARVVAWQRRHGRHDLPWQNTRDPYRIWLSEIMLQQTQVSAVIPYYQRFVAAFPDLASLAGAPIDRVLELWSGLGYYSRARNLHQCARTIVEQHNGTFPSGVDALAALPGIGRSTAAAICAFAFARRTAILEGNVKRVLSRHAGIDGYPGDARVERTLWSIATERLPVDSLPAYTQGMMDLGSMICVRSRPLCALCPVADDCVARRTHRTAELPTPRPKRAVPQRAVTMLLLTRHDAVLVEKRPPAGIWGGLWSLPELPEGISVERYCTTRFGAEVKPEHPLVAIQHGFTHFRLTITPQPCRVVTWNERTEEPGLIWLPLVDAHSAALPAPIKKVLIAIAG
jgi:A/G-specific adenine glycosylase